MTIRTAQTSFPGLWGINVGKLPKKSRVVSEEVDENDETMVEVEEGEDEGVCTDGEDEPPDNLR